MADLSNLKIANTFSRLLQVDPDTTQLQDGGGANPTVVTFNGTDLKYVDGNQQNNYVLTSDANGVASWAAAGGSSDIYWSANTDGSISPSGLTTTIGVGTTTPNKPLTVVGDISGTTDLYLGSSTHTGSTIFGEEEIIIKGRAVDNDFMTLKQDRIDFNLDGSQAASFIAPTHSNAFAGFSFNVSNIDMDFKIGGEDNFPIFNLDGETGINKVRLRDHLVIGSNEAISHANAVLWGFAVTGSSLFYGGENESDAIHASGVISASTKVLVGDGDGFMSAQTINAPSISATTLYGTIDGGCF